MSKPKIYVFSAHPEGAEGPAFAMAEDGTVLGEHYCSNEEFARGDLGALPGRRKDRHEAYALHYPDGYEMEFVPAASKADHVGFQAAWKLNQQMEE